MKKIVVFTEGQSEMIFVRNFLLKKIDNTKLSFECMKLNGGYTQEMPYKYNPPGPTFYFMIVDVGNDSRVLSAIREREGKLFEQGYEEIIGLRDMYSEEYQKRSQGIIDDAMTSKFINSCNDIIRKMSNPTSITILFSIMELESWFLSMYSIFEKFNSLLSVDYIEKQLGFNLKEIDPQKKFYRPSTEINRIFQLCGRNYKKSADDIEKITCNMEVSDFENAIENNRCDSFKLFYQKMDLITATD